MTALSRDLNVALQMIRDAVEELGPVAACSVSRDQFEPRPIADAEAIIAGILKMKEWAAHEGWSAGIEAAAALVEHCNHEGPYNAIASAPRIRALRRQNHTGSRYSAGTGREAVR